MARSSRYKADAQRRNILGLLFLLVVVIGLNVMPHPALTGSGMESALREVSKKLETVSGERDMKAVFTYDGITFTGWGFSRKAHINNPRIEFSEEGIPDALIVSTERLEVTADGKIATMLYVSMPKPLLLKSGEKAMARLEFPDAPVYRFDSYKDQDAKLKRHRVVLPPSFKIILDEQSAAVQVSYAENPFFQLIYDTKSGRQFSECRLQKLLIDDGIGKIALGSLVSSVTEDFEPDNRLFAEYSLNLQDIVLPEGMTNLGAISIDTRFKYNGEADANPFSDTPRSGVNELAIEKLNFVTSRFSGSAIGKLSRAPDDSLPYGKLDFSVVNLRQAVEEAKLDEEQRARWVETLQKMTGQTIETLDNATFSMTREKHANFMIGNAALEEVAGLMFSLPAQEVQLQGEGAPVHPPAGSEGPADALPTTLPSVTSEGEVPTDAPSGVPQPPVTQ